MGTVVTNLQVDKGKYKGHSKYNNRPSGLELNYDNKSL